MTSARTVQRTEVPAAGTWEIDPAHSDLVITARHLMVTKVRGTFGEIAGTIEVAEEPAQSSVRVVAKAASITTGAADRDNHLRSPDFLDAARYPDVTFQSTDLQRDGRQWDLTGDLTIRDVTKPVTFQLRFEGSAEDPFGNTKSAFTATGEIDREQWGLTWNVALEGGGVLVSRKLLVEFDVQATLTS